MCWEQGYNNVQKYVDVDEFDQWLRHNEPGVDKEYSQKLAGRAIDALMVLTKNCLYVKRKKRRKDGLSYKQQRVVCPNESTILEEMMFETDFPETANDSSH